MSAASGSKLKPIISDQEFAELAKASQNNIERHANLCAKRINSYWAEQGKDAQARVETETVNTCWGETYSIPAIRSALRNGIPT